MLHRCVVIVCVSVLSVLLCASTEDAPIVWPDPRHFHVSLDRQWGNGLTLHWPVSKYCAQNGILKFSVSVTKVGDAKFWRNVSGTRESLYTVLEQGEAEYLITTEMKTKFNVHGASANASITTGESVRFGSRSSREVFQVSAVGDGPFVVVVKHKTTEECLLIIYNTTLSDSYTIEAMDICQGGKRASLAISVPIRKQSLELSSQTPLLRFDLPSDLLKSLPGSQVQAYSLPTKAVVELDPPCDIYGKLELKSPKTARLIVTFRPPASHPRLIRRFTFVFSHINETIVFEVVDDKDLSKYRNKNVIGRDKIVRSQYDRTMQFEVCPKALYAYPGNYTVTAYTNDAASRRAVHPIIMPKFFALQPPFYEVYASWDSVTVKWDIPQLFPTSCTYLVDAVPYDRNASRVIQQPRPNQQRVTFHNLSPDAKYGIKLGSNCTGSDPFWTHLGDVETNAGIPGVPRDIKLTQSGPKSAKLTWNPPLKLPGKHPYYEWNCGLKNSYVRMRGKTEDTHTVLTNVGPGLLSCTVQAVLKTKRHMDNYGTPSSPVELHIDSAEYGKPTSTSTTPTTVSTSAPKGKEEVAVEKGTEAASITTQRPVPPETTHSTLSTAVKVDANTSQTVKPFDHKYSTLLTEQTTKGHVNTATVMRAVFGCLGGFLLVAILGLILQKWRRKNAAKMFEDPPPADLPSFYS